MQITHNTSTNRVASRCFSCGYTIDTLGGAPSATITLYYGTVDGGTNFSSWQYSRTSSSPSLTWNLSTNETISANTTYYYRFYVYTAYSSAWSSSSDTITTLSTTADVRAYNRPAFGGGSVCSAISRGGTMGLVCYKGSQRVLLSNWHVIAANTYYTGSLALGSNVDAPSISDGGGIEYPIGTLSDIEQVQMIVDPFNPPINTMDASIANITNSSDVSFAVPDIGTPIGYSNPSLGDTVYHQGRTTGYSYGTVDYVGSVSCSYGTNTGYFSEAYTASCFCMSGDSGSAVFKNVGGLIYFTGLVFAGSLSDGIQTTFVKASPIITRFGLSFTSSPVSPIISIVPSSFSFNANIGGSNPSSQTLTISNSGSGTLTWSLSKTQSWLSLSTTSGTNTGSSILSINITGLTVGTYTDTITVTSVGATNTPQTISVTLTIINPTLPSAPILSTPANGSNVNSTQVLLSWSASSGGGIDAYYIQMNTKVDFTGETIMASTLSGSDLSLNFLSLPNTGLTYYWRVRAHNSSGWGSFSTVWSFINGVQIVVPTITNSTGAINITTNAATLQGNLTSTGGATTSVYIYWGLIDGGIIGSNWSNSINLGTKAIGVFTSYISSLTSNKLYYYRCYAINSTGGSWASSTSNFTTLSTSIGPILIAPVNNSTTSGTSITFSWRDP